MPFLPFRSPDNLWAGSGNYRYRIEVRGDGGLSFAMMLQALLADRFALKIRRVSKRVADVCPEGCEGRCETTGCEGRRLQRRRFRRWVCAASGLLRIPGGRIASIRGSGRAGTEGSKIFAVFWPGRWGVL